MNKTILESLQQFKYSIPPPFLHPHQIATVDYLLREVKNHNNIALYHLMGTGKTFTTCITANILLSMNYRVIIITTNETTKLMFEEILNKGFVWTPTIKTKNVADIRSKDNIQRRLAHNELTLEYFYDSVIFIDEAHHWIDNKATSLLFSLNSCPHPPVFILLSGSPLTNTVTSFISFASVLLRERLNKYDFIKKGKKVTDIEIKDSIYGLIDRVKKQISYYEQEDKNIPPIVLHGSAIIQLPFIPIVMGPLQSKIYNIIEPDMNNKMFKKDLLSQSFALTGSVLPEDVKNHVTKHITSKLSLVNGVFKGPELYSLENSQKIRFFFDNFIINPVSGKTFVYFENATIGGRFMLDVLKTYNIIEFGQPIPKTFHCYLCGTKKTCKKCLPMRFIMINSYHTTKYEKTTDINILLDEFNQSLNDDGSYISLIFASKMIAESCTIKETRRAVLLTIPSTFSELSQILTRNIRVFSHKNVKKPFDIYILAAIPNNVDISSYMRKSDSNITSISKLEESYTHQTKKLEEYKKKLHLIVDDEEESDEFENILKDIDLVSLEHDLTPDPPSTLLPYDVEKIIYLEIKAGATNTVLSQIKNMPLYCCTIEKELTSVYIWEMLKLICYTKVEFTFDDVFSKVKDLISKEVFQEKLTSILQQTPIIISKIFGSCYLVKDKTDHLYRLVPFFVNIPNYVYSIPLNSIKI